MIQESISLIRPFLEEHSQAAPAIFILLHIVMAAFVLPCSIMTLLAGALWGGVFGLAISMLAALLSSVATFLLARSFLREPIRNFLFSRYPTVSQFLKRVELHDWKVIALSNLNPLIPASTLGYAFGLSKVSLSRYVKFSAIFMLPLQIIFVFTGKSVSDWLIFDGKLIDFFLVMFVIVLLLFFKNLIFRKLSQWLGL